jgi:hypothetical protein
MCVFVLFVCLFAVSISGFSFFSSEPCFEPCDDESELVPHVICHVMVTPAPASASGRNSSFGPKLSRSCPSQSLDTYDTADMTELSVSTCSFLLVLVVWLVVTRGGWIVFLPCSLVLSLSLYKKQIFSHLECGTLTCSHSMGFHAYTHYL